MLIVESGAGDADAETFVSVADARTRAGLVGLTLPTVDATLEVLLRRAAEYIGGYELRMQGTRTTETQALSFPRSGVVIHGTSLADDALPVALINATVQLAADFVANNPYEVGSGREVISEAVGPISTTYAKSGATVLRPVFDAAEKLLAPLLRAGGAFIFQRV